jgi:hypothetical protein
VTEKLPAAISISISPLRPPRTIPHSDSDNDTLVASLHAARIRYPSHSSSRQFIQTLARNTLFPQPGAEGDVCDVLPG